MAITIYDIAKEVKTSAVTVSLALRNSKRVSLVTRNRINDTAKRLGYQPNPLARGLIGGRTKTIAFVFNFPSEHFAHDLSYMELFHSISLVASSHDYKLFVHSSTVAKPVEEVFADVTPYGVDGIILGTNITTDNDRKSLEKAPIPTVLLGRDFCASNTSCLVYGGCEGAQASVRHLVELGHKRIAFAGKNRMEASMRRYDGYARSMRKAGLEINDDLIIESDWDIAAGEIAGVKLARLANRPTAILATTDMMALGVMAGLKEEGLDVPKDVSVIGFDNLHISRYSIPSLTSVDLQRKLIADNAMECLLDMLKEDGGGVRREVPSSLVVRNSTACCCD